jgi:aspartate aminotransferase
MFEEIEKDIPDPMFLLKQRADTVTSPRKIDLGVGIYRNETGVCHELDSIRQVRLIVPCDPHYVLIGP